VSTNSLPSATRALLLATKPTEQQVHLSGEERAPEMSAPPPPPLPTTPPTSNPLILQYHQPPPPSHKRRGFWVRRIHVLALLGEEEDAGVAS
jgi:hypothetical protein